MASAHPMSREPSRVCQPGMRCHALHFPLTVMPMPLRLASEKVPGSKSVTGDGMGLEMEGDSSLGRHLERSSAVPLTGR